MYLDLITKEDGKHKTAEALMMAFGHLSPARLDLLLTELGREGPEAALRALKALFVQASPAAKQAGTIIDVILAKSKHVDPDRMWPEIVLIGLLASASGRVDLPNLPAMLKDQFGIEVKDTEEAVAQGAASKRPLSETLVKVLSEHGGLILGLAGTLATKNPRWLLAAGAADIAADVVDDAGRK